MFDADAIAKFLSKFSHQAICKKILYGDTVNNNVCGFSSSLIHNKKRKEAHQAYPSRYLHILVFSQRSWDNLVFSQSESDNELQVELEENGGSSTRQS